MDTPVIFFVHTLVANPDDAPPRSPFAHYAYQASQVEALILPGKTDTCRQHSQIVFAHRADVA